MNEKLEKLLYRCNEMDITEQLNWLGDASMPYQAKLEYKKLEAENERLKKIEQVAGQTALALKFFKHTIVEQDMIVPHWVNNFIQALDSALEKEAGNV